MIRLAVPIAAYILMPVTLIIAGFVWKRRNRIVFFHSLFASLKKSGFVSCHPYKKILAAVRLLTLLMLALLIAKPQLVDPHSKIQVEGIDIVMVLDVSASMQFSDFDDTSRIDVAKREALRFIDKRDHDPIGIVLFGKHALSRCPLTLDKKMLHTIVDDIKLGIVDPDGTALSRAVLTAVNRLKTSSSTSKIIILLTDGEPSEGDLQPQVALEAAKRYGIKIYTIGIGSEEHRFFVHQLYGLAAIPRVNKELLDMFARETGGKSFLAKEPDDMRAIYDTINHLEKTTIETEIYTHYYDLFAPFVWFLLLVLLSELLVTTFVWFGIA